MKGRRLNRSTFLCAVLAGLVALVCAGPTLAAPALIDLQGRLLSVETVSSETGPPRQGLVLVEHRLDGTAIQERIEWTFDDALDTSPVLALDPRSGEPVVVWSRQNGRGTDLALSRRYPDGYWTPIQLLTRDEMQDLEPRIAVDPDGGLHVLWKRGGRGRPALVLQTFDLDSGEAAERYHPVEPIPRNQRPGGLPPEGDDAGGSDDPGVIGAHQRFGRTDHGLMLGCDGVTVYLTSGSRLEIRTLDPEGTWHRMKADMGRVTGDGSSSWQIVRTLLDSTCSQ